MQLPQLPGLDPAASCHLMAAEQPPSLPCRRKGGPLNRPLGQRSATALSMSFARGRPGRQGGHSQAAKLQQKVIVFSQWTSMLDVVERALGMEK